MRAGEVSTISPSRSNASPGAATSDSPLDAADVLPDWKRVEEFVGDEQQRPRGKLVDAVVPVGIGDGLLLELAQYGAGLDKMGLAAEAGGAQHAEGVRGEGSPARPQFDVNRIGRAPRTLPRIGEGGADHLAEHLADLRRGREVAARAERVARGVIICVAGFHEGFDGDRPFRRDPLPKRTLQRGHATEAVPTVGSTRTRRFAAVSMR